MTKSMLITRNRCIFYKNNTNDFGDQAISVSDHCRIVERLIFFVLWYFNCYSNFGLLKKKPNSGTSYFTFYLKLSTLMLYNTDQDILNAYYISDFLRKVDQNIRSNSKKIITVSYFKSTVYIHCVLIFYCIC